MQGAVEVHREVVVVGACLHLVPGLGPHVALLAVILLHLERELGVKGRGDVNRPIVLVVMLSVMAKHSAVQSG